MAAAIERVPLFPLAQVVLFPRTRVPLHVFEPRYRQLTADALAGNKRVGMVAVSEEHASALAGDPPTFSVGCVGRIASARRVPDGRYHLLLLGEARFRIRREPPRPEQRLYRVAEVERLEDPLRGGEETRVGALRGRAAELLCELLESRGGSGDTRAGGLLARLSGLDDGTFTDALCQALSFSTLEKQGLLEADGVAARLAQLVGLLDFKLAEGREPPSSPTLH